MRLEVQGLRLAYLGAGLATIRDLDLVVEAGSLTALLGPSGSGKTTVMKLIAGHLAPDAGEIRLGGRSLLGLPPERRRVAMVFQDPLLFPHLTLAGNVGFGLKLRGLPPAEVAAEVETMLDRVQLAGLGARRPHQLSGGQQQRAALARALVLRPDLLLLDEPLASLDAGLRDEMRSLIRRLQAETGVTTLIVTHDQSEAVVMADRVALLLEGRLAQVAGPAEIIRRPATEAVARFFGGVNFLDGQVTGGTFTCALGSLPLATPGPKGPARVTIRPEALRLGRGELRGRVTGVTFLGTQYRVELSVAGQPLMALVQAFGSEGPAVGADVALDLPAEALWRLPG
ncbi:ABC transporter ATP-binding protein [Tabrizicola aquatica]|uniref:ABC transporter ATP-binding protein n=1 Tax=Tabrizicola aquatica TaxID=909926 RepID=UPI000CD2271B|nr:ABC transporter ATP-binding protein [Tabrizicola aquatica]